MELNKRGEAISNVRESDGTTLIGLALFVTIEIVPVHLLLHMFSPWAAWILTILSAKVELSAFMSTTRSAY